MNDWDLLKTKQTAVDAAYHKERRMVQELLKHMAPGQSRRKEKQGEILTFDWVNETWPLLPIKLCAGPVYEGNLFSLISDLEKHKLHSVLVEQANTYSEHAVGVVFDVRGDGLPFLVLHNGTCNKTTWALMLPRVQHDDVLWVQTLAATARELAAFAEH